MEVQVEMDMSVHMDLTNENIHIVDLMQKDLFPSSAANSSDPAKLGKRRALSLSKITIEDFYEYFDKPIVAVAREFGVCTTLFKKICRKSGIRRWPYRKISSLSKTIEAIQETLTQDLTSVERSKMISQLEELTKKRDYVRKNPNSKVALVKPADALSIAGRFAPKRPMSTKPREANSDSQSDPPSSTALSPYEYSGHDYDLCDELHDDFHTMYNHHPLIPSDLTLDDYNCVVEI
ncbi:hypothetical protein AC1031_013264 [Aphanomyces cochlioides]|nr:hypothetical protein AC1031_013264 [Aphanomyces cochlioides]